MWKREKRTDKSPVSEDNEPTTPQGVQAKLSEHKAFTRHLKFWVYKTNKRAEFKITYKLPTWEEIKKCVRDCHGDKSPRNDE